ncbi:MAG: helix-turn-helix transcriptional regulator [Spirochaetia bacterium]|nr:helix-turn-helix transcriptional regulator [Spirochaetia bacterium]
MSLPPLPKRFTVYRRHLKIPNFYCLGRAHLKAAQEPIPMHSHILEMEIGYLASGRQAYYIEDRLHDMRGNDLLIVKPGEMHGTLSLPAEKTTLYWLNLDMRFLNGSFLGAQGKEARKLHHSLRTMKRRFFRGDSGLKSILDRIIQTFISKKPFHRTVIQNLLTEFAVQVVDFSQKKENQHVPFRLKSSLDYISKNVEEDIRVETLAKMSGLSPGRFRANFIDAVGIPPKEYILREKFNRAKVLLKKENTGVTRIAHDLHFSSSQHFATAFRRYTGLTPLEFRDSGSPSRKISKRRTRGSFVPPNP